METNKDTEILMVNSAARAGSSNQMDEHDTGHGTGGGSSRVSLSTTPTLQMGNSQRVPNSGGILEAGMDRENDLSGLLGSRAVPVAKIVEATPAVLTSDGFVDDLRGLQSPFTERTKDGLGSFAQAIGRENSLPKISSSSTEKSELVQSMERNNKNSHANNTSKSTSSTTGGSYSLRSAKVHLDNASITSHGKNK
jgi:hypothetical protein